MYGVQNTADSMKYVFSLILYLDFMQVNSTKMKSSINHTNSLPDVARFLLVLAQ